LKLGGYLSEIWHPKVSRWSRWRPFPDPRSGGHLSAPFGPGVYELRNRMSGELPLFGKSRNVAKRMSSLLCRPLSSGTRHNSPTREYVLKQLPNIDYRTKGCAKERVAKAAERKLRAANEYRFPS